MRKLIQLILVTFAMTCIAGQILACAIATSLPTPHVFTYSTNKLISVTATIPIQITCNCPYPGSCPDCLVHHDVAIDWYIDFTYVATTPLTSPSLTIDNVLLQSYGITPGVHVVGAVVRCLYFSNRTIHPHCFWGSSQWNGDPYGLAPVAARPVPYCRHESSQTVDYHINMDALWNSDMSWFEVNAADFICGGIQEADSTCNGILFPQLTPPDGKFIGDVSARFQNCGPYDLVVDGYFPNRTPPGYECVYTDSMRAYWFRETPSLTLDSITSSTSEDGTYLDTIEPAYGDSVTFHWRRSYNEFHAQSIVILNQDPQGTIVESPDSSTKYSIVATASLADSTNIRENDRGQISWNFTGDLTWPKPGEHFAEFPSGNLRVGIKYDDGHVEMCCGNYVPVALSIYDIYTKDNASVVPGEASDEGKTHIHYSLSSAADSVRLDVGGIATWENAPSTQGHNTVEWDGRRTQNQPPLSQDLSPTDPGSYAIGVHAISDSCVQGSALVLSNVTNRSSFIPQIDELLYVSFDVSEPVTRPQARRAILTAYIYDPDGRMVRHLGADLLINNRADLTNGHNTVVWDGKDDNGRVVTLPGKYTVALLATDAAGVGCESDFVTTDVEVESPHIAEPVLMWPVHPEWTDPAYVPVSGQGYTDSESPVICSWDAGAVVQSVAPDGEGMFVVNAPAPGRHSLTLRTADANGLETCIDAECFENNLTLTGLESESRHCTESGQGITVTVHSQTDDTVDLEVYDPFDQAVCIGKQNPLAAADMMNGLVSPKRIRVQSGIVVSSTTEGNTITWDGKDDTGQPVKPGVYDIVVKRDNADGLLSTEITTRVVLEHPSDAPQISDITHTVTGNSVSVSWNTLKSTSGYVVYESDGVAVGKVIAGVSSPNHTVWLPGIRPDTTYSYYVVATDPDTGSMAISQRQTVVVGEGISFANVSSNVVCNTPTESSCNVSFDLSQPAYAALEYALVGPAVAQLQWSRAQHSGISQHHSFELTGLQPNAEYVCRAISSTQSDFGNPSISDFSSFAMKRDPASVEFVGCENGEVMQTLAEVTVRASDAERARYSTHGITGVVLLVDGRKIPSDHADVTQGNDGRACIDYTFELASLCLGTGVHSLDAVAYDDYGQSSIKSIHVIVDSSVTSQALGQRTAASYPGTDLDWLDTLKGGALVRLYKIAITFYYLGEPGQRGMALINHMDLRIPDLWAECDAEPDLKHKDWWYCINHGNLEWVRAGYALKGVDHLNRPVTTGKGEVSLTEHFGNDGYPCDLTPSTHPNVKRGYRNHAYPVLINHFELLNLYKVIEEEAARPDDYKCCPPNPESKLHRTQNCCTWLARVLKKAGIDKGLRVRIVDQLEPDLPTSRQWWWNFYPMTPGYAEIYAKLLNDSRKSGNWDHEMNEINGGHFPHPLGPGQEM